MLARIFAVRKIDAPPDLHVLDAFLVNAIDRFRGFKLWVGLLGDYKACPTRGC
jgi:hypothetical protein